MVQQSPPEPQTLLGSKHPSLESQPRSSNESAQPLLASSPSRPQSTTVIPSPQPSLQAPGYDEYYAPRARDFGDTASLAPSAISTLPAYTPVKQYGRFKTEASYLAALREFAEEKKYMDPTRDVKGREISVLGFYGAKSMSEYVPPTKKERKPNAKGDGAGDEAPPRRKESLTGLGLRQRMKARKKSEVA